MPTLFLPFLKIALDEFPKTHAKFAADRKADCTSGLLDLLC